MGYHGIHFTDYIGLTAIKNTSNISLKDAIFRINSVDEFNSIALTIFNYQYINNPVYNTFVKQLKIVPLDVKSLEDIPFLPIEFFKTQDVSSKYAAADNKKQGTSIKYQVAGSRPPGTSEARSMRGNFARKSAIFTSSGTIQSRHYVDDVEIYEQSFRKAFQLFYGAIEEYCVLALLPSYLEREGSSLVFMADDLIRNSKHPDSGFYLNDYDALISRIEILEQQHQKTILLGVTYALLDLIEKNKFQLKHTIIMETGGMKGKRKEMVRDELHKLLCEGFGVEKIHSDYGMTELLSQAYSKGDGIFYCPPWMKILTRDTNDPFCYLNENRTGGINVIDLANIHSCSFIATQDLGKRFADGSFEVLGRFDNSDIRGCNLMVG